MKLSSFLFVSGIVLVAVIFCTSFSKIQRDEPLRPNILWISCEDLSPHFDFYGDSTVRTPNLSRLAQQGVVYNKVFTTAGVCAPSRCAIITGVNQVTAGGQHMRTLLNTFPEKTGLPKSYSIVPPEPIKAFPEYLRRAGYYCTNNVKTDYQFEAPVMVWDENSDTASWQKRKSGQPFFSVFNFMVTHESQVWMRNHHPLHVAPEKVSVPPVYPDTKTVRQDLARFYSNIVDLDSMVGVLMKKLEDDGLLENTIVFFWSDHGDGLPFFKRELYDRGLHVPLVIRFPGKANAGARVNDLISSIDFAPTVLSIAGVRPPEYMQGKPFLGKYKSKELHQYVFAARDRMDSEVDRVRAVRDERYKYIRNFYPDRPRYQNVEYRLQQNMMVELLDMNRQGTLSTQQSALFATSKPIEELYDLENDPFELNNLAGQSRYEGDLLRFRQVLSDWLKRSNDQGAVEEKQMIERMWKGQGKPPVTDSVNIVIKGTTATLQCITQGASIGYQIIPERAISSKSSWNVYDKPVKLQPGETIVAFAHRIGYAPGKQTRGKVAR